MKPLEPDCCFWQLSAILSATGRTSKKIGKGKTLLPAGKLGGDVRDRAWKQTAKTILKQTLTQERKWKFLKYLRLVDNVIIVFFYISTLTPSWILF